MGNNSNIF
jgi:tyrosyl-DNA phosphodiesterase 1